VTPPFLSIIIPAYNEEKRLPQTLEQACSFVLTQSYPAEILVVENGSQDRTAQVAAEFAARHPFVHALHSEPRGKGWAVRTGMLAASGDYRFICDADLSMPIEEINRFLPPAIPDAPIVIASREGHGARRYNEPQYRHFIGRIFNGMVKIFALPGLQDSQCGFKCFRADVAERLFPLQTIGGWTFDVEILFIARKRCIPVRELGIPWHFNPDSKVRFWRDSWRMALDLFKIRWNSLRGRYDPPL